MQKFHTRIPTSHIFSLEIDNIFSKYKYVYVFKARFKFVKCVDPVATVPSSDTHITYLFSQIKLKISFVNINILKEIPPAHKF